MSEDPNTHPSGKNVYYVHPVVPRLRKACRIMCVLGLTSWIFGVMIMASTPRSAAPNAGYMTLAMLAMGLTCLMPLGLMGWLSVLLLGVMRYRIGHLLGIVLVGGLIGAAAVSDIVPDDWQKVMVVALVLYGGMVAMLVARADRAFGEGRILVRNPDEPAGPLSDS